jgi:hypothetical protein
MTCIIMPTYGGVRVRGIVEDETIFEHAIFGSLREFAEYGVAHGWEKSYNVVCCVLPGGTNVQ